MVRSDSRKLDRWAEHAQDPPPSTLHPPDSGPTTLHWQDTQTVTLLPLVSTISRVITDTRTHNPTL